jgi:hypothetical protein
MQQTVCKTEETVVSPAGGVWEPIRLSYLGTIGELMRATNAGSKRDSSMGCGTTRRRTGTGTPC